MPLAIVGRAHIRGGFGASKDPSRCIIGFTETIHERRWKPLGPIGPVESSVGASIYGWVAVAAPADGDDVAVGLGR